MPLRSRKPTSPGRRFQTVSDFSEITRDRPERSLVAPQPGLGRPQQPTAARPPGTGAAATSASTGSSTSAGTRTACPAKVAAIEYDPNRNARIALLHYLDGEKRYILAPAGVKVGRPAPERPGGGDPARQRPAACATSRSAR